MTGSNRGIGLALCKEFKARGDEVIATCRKSSPELDALGVEIVAGVDGTSDESVAGLARRLAERRIDVLVLNAGILREDNLGTLNLRTVGEQIAVNAIAPLRVAHELVSICTRGPRSRSSPAEWGRSATTVRGRTTATACPRRR